MAWIKEKIKKYWSKIGPGLVTGAADDDPSGIATYSQAGAGFGFTYLWLAAYTYPLMAVVQEMCARIALVTGRGLAANIRAHFSKYALYLCGGLVVFANTLTIGADLGGMADAVRIFLPDIPIILPIIVIALGSATLEIFLAYNDYARYLKLLAFSLLAYIAAGFVINLDWGSVLYAGFVPSFSFTKEGLIMMAAIFGTTISPYLFFWGASEEVEEEIRMGEDTVEKRKVAGPKELKRARSDIWGGMFFSNLVAFFIIAVCAATLFPAGITDIQSAGDAAKALFPLAGNGATLLFALGIISTGLLAIPVLAGSSAYIIAEAFSWKEGLYRKPGDAKAFYSIIALSVIFGILFNILGINPIKALIYSSVANALVAPVSLVFVVILAGSGRVMGEWKSGKVSIAIGWLTIGIMVALGWGIFFL